MKIFLTILISLGMPMSQGFAEEFDIKKILERTQKMQFDKEKQKQEINERKAKLKGWKITRETSKIDDSLTIQIYQRSNSKFYPYPNVSKYSYFYIDCIDNTTRLFFEFQGKIFIPSKNKPSRYRIDKNKAQKITLLPSNSGSYMGLRYGSTSIPFIKKLLNSKNLVIEVFPYRSAPVEVDFDTIGLKEAIKPVRKACNW